MKPCLSIFNHIKRYQDKGNSCVAAKLLPGEYYVTQFEEMITTVLGSCVSACIYDPTTKVGGMNHFMLAGEGSNSTNDESARYGLFAMESLINEILKCGVRKSDLKAKLFGGGKIIENMSNIGKNNILFAKKFLYVEGIPLESSDLGLVYPRKVNFFPHSGKVKVMRLKSVHNKSLEQQEAQYKSSLQTRQTTSDIELF